MDQQKPHISVSEVTRKLKGAYRTFNSRKKNVLFLRAGLILLAGFTSLIVAEELLYFSATTKTVSVFLLLAASALSVWYGLKSFGKQSFEEFYRNFSRKSKLPELKDSLDLENNASGNPALVNAAILQNMTRIQPRRLDESLQSYIEQTETHSQFKRLGIFTGLFIVVAAFTAFNFSSASGRTFTFWQNYTKPNPYLFTVKPGDVTIEQGDSFNVSVTYEGSQRPEEVMLQIKTNVEEEFRSRAMTASGDTYTSIPFDLNNNLEYYVQMDEYKSKTYTASVQLPPRFTDLRASVTPPAYTGLDSVQLSYPFAQIRAYQGSRMKLSGMINKQVSSLKMFTVDDTISLETNTQNAFTYSLDITGEDTLSFLMEDKNGLNNKNPFQVILAPQQDEYPVVEILEPEASYEEVNPSSMDLLFRATDDFGLSSARLGYELRRAYVEQPLTGSISLSTPASGALQSFSWNMEDLRLKPQDVLSFWVEVDDNDGYNGHKTSRSQVLTLTIPSMVDYFENLDEKEQEVGTELDDVSESFKQMQERYDEFKEKMKEQPERVGYEQKRELEQVKKLQEDVQKKVEELNQKFEEIKQELSQNNMLSEETQQAYDELQKLMKEIDDPEFLDMMEEMRQELGQFSPEQLRQMMEQTEFKEEEYRERLQRTIDLFKQLKLNSDLDKLTQSFKDMARKEEEMDQNNSVTEERNQQREKSIEDTEKLKEQVEKLSENTSRQNEKAVNEFQKGTQQELDQLLQKLEEQLAEMKEEQAGNEQENESGSEGENQQSQDEQQNRKEDKQNNQSDKQQQQDQNNQQQGNQSQNQNQQQQNQQSQSAQQTFQQLASKTEELRQSLNQEQMQINIAGLQYTLYSMLNLSSEQEDLVSLASSAEDRSQAYVGYARDQKNIESIFSNIADSLYQLSTQIPQLSNRINTKKLEVEKQLSRSTEQMAERNQSQSSVASRQAMGGINEIAFMVANLLEQLQNSQNNGGGSSGSMSMQQMMQQMQQMGQNQQQLNQRLQNLINDIQGERLNQDQMERLNQIARQQNQIRKQLQELQQNGALEDGDKLGSELQRMVEDMEDTINDLRGGVTDPTMVKRQQNILSRMLESERAMQERDQQEKREGSTAEEMIRQASPEMTLEELEKQIRNRLNDPNFTKYSTDYQRLIEKYFELLKQLQQPEIQ